MLRFVARKQAKYSLEIILYNYLALLKNSSANASKWSWVCDIEQITIFQYEDKYQRLSCLF